MILVCMSILCSYCLVMLYNKPRQISVGCHNEHLFHGCVTGGQWGSARLGSRIQAVPRSGPHVSDVFGPMAT